MNLTRIFRNYDHWMFSFYLFCFTCDLVATSAKFQDIGERLGALRMIPSHPNSLFSLELKNISMSRFSCASYIDSPSSWLKTSQAITSLYANHNHWIHNLFSKEIIAEKIYSNTPSLSQALENRKRLHISVQYVQFMYVDIFYTQSFF